MENRDLKRLSHAFLRRAKENLRQLIKGKIACSVATDGSGREAALFQQGGLFLEDQGVWEFFCRQAVPIERLERFGLGWIDSPSAMWDRLVQEGFAPQELRDSHLLADQRLAGRLVGPIQSVSGQIVSFWARKLDQSQGPVYLYWRPDWRAKVPAVWLPTALLRGGRKKGLLVVEDIWEGLLLQLHGFLRTVALGESGHPMLAKRLEQFAALGVESLTVVLDRTEEVEVRLAWLREAFLEGVWPFCLWILPPEALAPYRSPGEWVHKEGPGAFQKLLRSKRIAIRPDQPQIRPEPPKPVCSSVFSVRAEEAAAGSKFCPLHHCPETECFCFD